MHTCASRLHAQHPWPLHVHQAFHRVASSVLHEGVYAVRVYAIDAQYQCKLNIVSIDFTIRA